MREKELKHNQKINELKKHFKKLKMIAIALWLVANIVIDTVATVFFTVEVIVFAIIITLIISTMIMINYLNRLDKIRITQETELLEKSPLGRLKI